MSKYLLTSSQYEELFKEVMLFAEIGGVTQDEDVIWGMCYEEVKELRDALLTKHRTNIIDGCCDVFVTSVQLHSFHFEKIKPYNNPVVSLYEADFSESTMLHLLESKNKDIPQLCMQIWYLWAVQYAEACDFNLYQVVKEVNKSNFTKYPTYEEVVAVYGDSQTLLKAADECMDLAKSHGKDYPNVVATVNAIDGIDYVVFRQDNGKSKIVKPFRFFKEPDFTEKF